jgi:GntR family transcriptional regulator / MocR family aminotransferase
VLDGKLSPGERLPSSRDLAQDLDLSRNTVVAAINQLTVEGYLAAMWAAAPMCTTTCPGPAEAQRSARPRLPAGTPAGGLSARGRP